MYFLKDIGLSSCMDLKTFLMLKKGFSNSINVNNYVLHSLEASGQSDTMYWRKPCHWWEGGGAEREDWKVNHNFFHKFCNYSLLITLRSQTIYLQSFESKTYQDEIQISVVWGLTVKVSPKVYFKKQNSG